tara:strand:- start:1652 stop:3298 length:1647 start_codon:yes stop_codon:yes gene_type:complete
MAVTSIDSVVTDAVEYSKYEPNRAVIEVRTLVTGDDDTLTVELRKARRDRTVTVVTTTIIVPVGHASTTPLYVNIDTRTDAIQATDLYSLIRRGQYFIRVSATSVVSTTIAPPDPNINDITLTVVAAGAFPATGEIRIDDGGTNEETIAYDSIAGNVFTLSTGLQVDHGLAETVDLFNVIGDSVDFGINIITAAGLRDTYLFGIDLQSSDVRSPKFQPRQVTGLEILEVSRNHRLSFFPLNLDVSGTAPNLNYQLSWDNGELIPVTIANTEYLLPASGDGAEWVRVRIDLYRLPTASIRELVFIDELTISDDTIRDYIRRATDTVEFTQLHCYLEPTQVVTDLDVNDITFSGDGNTIVINSDHDFVINPVTFYPRREGHWIDIQFPVVRVLDITELFGAVANTRVVHINTEWIEWNEYSGFTELVPFNTELAFDFVGLIWVESLRSATPVPNFWHFNLIAGLRDVTGEIIELIGKQAAIPILTVAGQAFKGGFASQSISRDGVSESVSYTSSAIYGVYSATIEEYKTWIRENLGIIKSKYRGPLLLAL